MSNQGDSVSSSALSLVDSSSTFVFKPAGTAANGPDSNSSYLRPAYFVERLDGTFTALIEVDQLPDFIRIRGLPSKLAAVDTGGMTSVGVKEGNQKKYSIDIADISGKFCFSELSKTTTHENASVAPTTTPSSKAPVSQSLFETTRQDFFFLANYIIERCGDRVARPRLSHNCRGVFLDHTWSRTRSHDQANPQKRG